MNMNYLTDNVNEVKSRLKATQWIKTMSRLIDTLSFFIAGFLRVFSILLILL
jgi:hypothetical protein